MCYSDPIVFELGMIVQVDVECEFGFEWSWGRRECVAMPGVDPNTCAAVREKRYIMSQSHLRLVNADNCANVSLVINDTDGRGHSTLPPRGFHLPGWAIVIVALLVCCFPLFAGLTVPTTPVS
jgi:hypothetical protein